MRKRQLFCEIFERMELADKGNAYRNGVLLL